MSTTPDMLTLQDCADRARVSVSTIKREVRDGKLPVSRVRGRVTIARADWEEYLKSCRSAPMAKAGKSAVSMPMDGLAKLLGIGEPRARARGGSKIIELAERRSLPKGMRGEKNT